MQIILTVLWIRFHQYETGPISVDGTCFSPFMQTWCGYDPDRFGSLNSMLTNRRGLEPEKRVSIR